jgi:hypothetical protein
MPLRQTSFRVQALPSSHGEPLGFFTTVHWPVAGLHVPAWHASLPPQVIGAPATQAPA